MRANEEALDRLESTLGVILQIGVSAAALCLFGGLVLWMTGTGGRFANGLLTLGLLMLMATPLMRVIVSLVAYARMRDWFFVGTTVMVFLTLLLAWLIKA